MGSAVEGSVLLGRFPTPFPCGQRAWPEGLPMSEFPCFGQKEASFISFFHFLAFSIWQPGVGGRDWFEDTYILEQVPDKSWNRRFLLQYLGELISPSEPQFPCV